MDFVQAVWQSFFDRLCMDSYAGVRELQHLRGFLDGMARNKVFEQHRRLTKTEKYAIKREERLYVRRGDREVERELVAREPTPSQTAQAGERLAQLIAGCNPREVEVITLRYQGLTLDEIAARTGICERTARRIIDAARDADGGSWMAMTAPTDSASSPSSGSLPMHGRPRPRHAGSRPDEPSTQSTGPRSAPTLTCWPT